MSTPTPCYSYVSLVGPESKNLRKFILDEAKKLGFVLGGFVIGEGGNLSGVSAVAVRTSIKSNDKTAMMTCFLDTSSHDYWFARLPDGSSVGTEVSVQEFIKLLHRHSSYVNEHNDKVAAGFKSRRDLKENARMAAAGLVKVLEREHFSLTEIRRSENHYHVTVAAFESSIDD